MMNRWLKIIILLGFFIWGLVIDLRVFKRGVYNFSFDECRLPILLVWSVVLLGVYFGRKFKRQEAYLYMYLIGWVLAYFCSWVAISAIWLGLGLVLIIGGLVADER